MSVTEHRRAEGRVYGGRSAAERRADRRAGFVAAGLELFGTVGYQHVTIERICAQARLSSRNFYDDFSDREALLRAVYDLVVDDARQAVEAALATAPDEPRSRTHAGLGAFVHSMLDDPRRASVACLQVVGLSDELESHRRQVLDGFVRLLEAESRLLADGGRIAPRGDYRMRSTALVGGVLELLVHWLADPAPPPVDAVVDELVDLFIAASAPSGAEPPTTT